MTRKITGADAMLRAISLSWRASKKAQAMTELHIPAEALEVDTVEPNPRMPVRHDTEDGRWHYHNAGPLMSPQEHTMTELPIPDEAYDALSEGLDPFAPGISIDARELVDAIARPVLIAWLRWLGDSKHVSMGTISSETVFDLADELEAGR